MVGLVWESIKGKEYQLPSVNFSVPAVTETRHITAAVLLGLGRNNTIATSKLFGLGSSGSILLAF